MKQQKELEQKNKRNNKKVKYRYRNAEVLILVISTAIICFISGSFLSIRITKLFKNQESNNEMQNELSEIEETYQYILNNYYGEIDKEKLIENAISGMINSLTDNNSTYISEEASNNFNALLDGTYYGAGVEIVLYDDNIRVSSVFKNSPADKAGIKPADIIVSINGISTKGLSTQETVNLIKEKQNIKLVIERDGTKIEKTLNLETVIIDSIYSEIIEKNDKKIGYIYISIFALNTYEQFKTNLQELEKQNIDSLIIDVRSNSGGHITSASKILSLFLKSDKIIYQLEDKNGIKKYYSEGNEDKTYPIVVLVNGESASASEILASTLKEQYGAKLVGETTYGKGTVQELNQTESGLQYKITTQHWLTSNGIWIDGKGIEVDYEIKLDDEYYKNPTEETDSQLQKAIEILK